MLMGLCGRRWVVGGFVYIDDDDHNRVWVHVYIGRRGKRKWCDLWLELRWNGIYTMLLKRDLYYTAFHSQSYVTHLRL